MEKIKKIERLANTLNKESCGVFLIAAIKKDNGEFEIYRVAKNISLAEELGVLELTNSGIMNASTLKQTK